MPLKLLGYAPDPQRAARLSKADHRGAAASQPAQRRGESPLSSRCCGRRRLRQPAQVQAAFAAIAASLVRLLTTLNGEIAQLGEVVAHHVGRHRNAEIYTSQPGLGVKYTDNAHLVTRSSTSTVHGESGRASRIHIAAGGFCPSVNPWELET